jgi:bifunctional enzyme CysN/CysC
MPIKSTNITEVAHRVAERDRWRVNGHRGGVLWFTGLSGSGKTTLAFELELRLFKKGYQVFVLDGDNVRHGISADLGFTPEERAENIRRVGEVAALFAAAGVLALTAFISPYRGDRARARAAVEHAIGNSAFHEVYLSADVTVCEQRDPKGLYAKARRGEIPDFTGVSAPYEPPSHPELTLDTGSEAVEQSLTRLLDYVERTFKIF